jgi:hypothetical protein
MGRPRPSPEQRQIGARDLLVLAGTANDSWPMIERSEEFKLVVR